MILDSQMMMSDKQALVADTTSTNTIEIPRLAPGHNLDMHLALRVHSESGTDVTLQATLETSSDGSSFTPVHTLVKPPGKSAFGCSLDNLNLYRYLRISYVLGGDLPLFNVSAMLAAGSDDSWQAYPDSARIV
jgi:hypothetical protein